MAFAKAQELLQLAMLATRRRGVSLDEIVEEFGCAHRTAQRMSAALMSTFPQTEQIYDEDRRARWVLPIRTLTPFLMPSADELAALVTAITELGASRMLREAGVLRQLEKKVRALIPPEAGRRLEVDEEALLEALGHAARPGPRPVSISAVDSAIAEALKGPFLLRILYRKRDEEHPRERVVAPHGLLLGVRRYLVARDTGKPAGARLQHYSVEDIYEAEVLDQSFTLDKDFNIRHHAERGFGSYESDKEYGEVIWRFKPESAQHARRFIFHPTQEITELDDGSILVKFYASGFLEMCWHLYSWGNSVEVISPPQLRDMVRGYQRDFPALP
ncbi:helix-turn-helix transcriptional regulator [Nitrospirillum bahiense]|uniref:Putative DNA-binding transcriptional regulator YafY n=1 Tax=Nitrospirillum amazonense TaxID=28077 RepID=A0A560G1I5_9PROT|nr:WYL domain-containing protein [Nitrospirillum amazonense]TWB27704.1 putative DNA-binding transcriptional regulator YafY [Nitrospirillum amazonense]